MKEGLAMYVTAIVLLLHLASAASSRACCVPSGSIPLSDGCDEYPAPSRLRTVSCDEDEKLSCTECIYHSSNKNMAESRLVEFYREITADLQRTMDFWTKYSHDTEHGGFLNCIGPTGDVYDETKHVWFQGRQIWMYARLYNEDTSFKRQDILDTAIQGAEFLLKYAKDPVTHKCYLSLTRDGRPIKTQRSIFSECFYTLAMSELARATGDQKYKDEALLMMDKMIYWVREDWTDVRQGMPALEGITPTNALAVPMMLLCLIEQMTTMESSLASNYADISDWSLKQALAHIQRDGSVILENVSPEGAELPGSHGRLMIPGHSIEAGWFLLRYAVQNNMPDLKQTAVDKFIVNPFQYGWDKEHGGLFYFLDVDGHSPLQLEWNMKLWWTHNEALIAFLMAYQQTNNPDMLEKFATVFDYCYTKHVDRKSGDWFGYLNRDGSVSMDFKGGPWKGCFHLPRALLLCKQMLKDILDAKK